MKYIYKFAALLLSLTLIAGFTACSDDDDITYDNMVGIWKLNKVEGWYLDNNDNRVDETYTPNYDWTFTFNQNGTGVEYDNEDGDEDSYDFKWTLTGNNLVIDYDAVGIDTERYVVEKLKNKELVWGQTASDGSSYAKYRFTKQ